MNRLARRQVVALSLAGLALLLATVAALAATGDINQPAGIAGCVSEDGSAEVGSGPCADGHALIGASSVAVSSNGTSAYVASYFSDAVVRLRRDTTSGAITQPAGSAGCISKTGAGPCADGHGLNGAYSVAVSPDGKSVYVASRNGDAVARFQRNTTTGALAQSAGNAGCISETGAGHCADGHGLDRPRSVAVSADGKSVYVASYGSDAVARFARNTATGVLDQPPGSAGCISETGAGHCADGHGLDGAHSVAASPDGKSIYVASYFSDAVSRLNRNTTTGAIGQPPGSAGCISEDGSGPCADGHGLSTPSSVAVSADRKNVYFASYFSNAVGRLDRNTTTGAITQPAGSAGCISEDGSGPCADGHGGLYNPTAVVVSADGKSIYVASNHAVARLNRDTTTGAITQPAGSAGCVTLFGAAPCADGHALASPHSAAVSADGKNVYFASQGSTDEGVNAVVRFNRAP